MFIIKNESQDDGLKKQQSERVNAKWLHHLFMFLTGTVFHVTRDAVSLFVDGSVR